MKFLSNVETWGDKHHPKIVDLVRITLGVFLLVKGTVFLNNYAYIRDLIISTNTLDMSSHDITLLIYYVTYIHMIGGIFICLGLITRLASLLQIPIVFGAVFFVNITDSYFNSELWLSILVLALLFLFMIIGSGPLSIDRIIKNVINNDESPKRSV